MDGIHLTCQASSGSRRTGCGSTCEPGSASGTTGASTRPTSRTSPRPPLRSTSRRTPTSSGRPGTTSVLVDALASLLADRPGATVAELSLGLRAAGHDAGEPTVHRLLFAAHGRFRCDDSSPPRWWLAHGHNAEHRSRAAPLDADLSRRPGRHTASVRLYAWQAEALDAWERRGRRGVVEAVTGTGKTMVGVAAVLEQLRGRGQALVLVPTRELQGQWTDVLSASLPRGTLVGQ